MSKKVNKIKKEQLDIITKQQGDLNDMLRSLGILDVQKQNLHQKISDVSTEVEKLKKELEEEYGSVNIDLATGEYTKIEKPTTENKAETTEENAK